MAGSDMLEEIVLVSGHEVSLLRPRDSDALIDEHAFEHEEFLPYWADLWPSALVLAETVVNRALHGKRVLELGCGLGLPSICAAFAGGRVTASDWSPEAIELLVANARRNGAEVAAVIGAWQAPDVLVEQAPWDVVLAADVLYEQRNLPLLLELLPRLAGQRGTVWLADPGRSFIAEFLQRAADGAWTVETLTHAQTPKASVYELRRA